MIKLRGQVVFINDIRHLNMGLGRISVQLVASSISHQTIVLPSKVKEAWRVVEKQSHRFPTSQCPVSSLCHILFCSRLRCRVWADQ